MKRSIGRLGILLSLLMFAQAESAESECTVADPTGTPLNVRDAPNGQVVMRLSNGANLRRTGERDHGGKRWSLVANQTGILGWVFSAYLDCASVDRDRQKSAPMRPRPTSN